MLKPEDTIRAIVGGFEAADAIRDDAEAEHDRATAILCRLLGGSLWGRCDGETIPLQ